MATAALVATGIITLRGGPWMFGTTVVVCVVGLALMLAYLRRAQLVLTQDELVRVGLVGQRGWPRNQIAKVLNATLRIRGTRVSEFHGLYLLDRRGRKVLYLRTLHWADADLNRLIKELGVPVEVAGDAMSPSQFATRYPGVLSFTERRPQLTAYLAIGVVIAVIIGIAVVVD